MAMNVDFSFDLIDPMYINAAIYEMNGKTESKNPYTTFFVELGRRDWVWEAYLRKPVSFSSQIYYCT